MNEAEHSQSEVSAAPAGLVIAGGNSRRFGSDKARHPVGGAPMIVQVYRALSGLAQPVVVSIGTDADSYGDILPADVLHVRDRRSDAGPLAGLDAGLRAFNAAWVLVAACDMPNATAAGFEMLLEARTNAADAIVAEADGQRHPLFAAYRPSPTLEAIEACWATEAYALFDLLDRLQVHTVDVSPRLVHNVNRREDVPDG